MERKINTLLCVNFHIPFPEKLSAKERAERWRELQWYWQYEQEARENNGNVEL